MRKQLLTSAAVLALSAGAAFASDLPTHKGPPPAPTPAPVFTWTGCYVGVQAGIDFGNSKWSDPSGYGTVSYPTNGGIFGGQVGCNYQIQNFVIGAEGELWGSTLSGSTTKLLGGEGGGYGFKTRSDFAGDLSVRAGYAFDRVLVFGKLGAAWAHYTFTETYPLSGSPDTGHGDYSGLLLGLGLEYALDSHWSVKGEYDFIDYGSKNIAMYTVLGAYDYTPKISNYENIIKAAVNYRF
jgi:outer membrane immunogenic protein